MTMQEVYNKTGADYLLNGGMWNADGSPCPLLKVGGKWLSKRPWTAWGYGWNKGPDVTLTSNADSYQSFIAVTPLISDGRKLDKLSYATAQGGRRGRSAIGLDKDRIVLYCTGDGTADAKTPEQLRDELASMGLQSSVMLDGGGSSQCRYPDKSIKASRKVHNWIAVYLKKEVAGPVNDKYKVDPAVGVNVRFGPSTSYGKVGSYACGAVVEVAATQNGWGKTLKGWVSMDYLSPVAAPADRVTDAGITIRQDLIPAGRKNRPGGTNPDQYITIHETGNFAKGADASAHAAYLKSDAAVKAQMSWHYTVDDHAIVQHIPDGEKAWHAGDGANGPGNSTSIGIEICVDAGGDFAQAKRNAAALVRLLRKEHGIGLGNVVQHNHWNGKDCPYTIRHTAGGWDNFLSLVKKSTKEDKPVENKWYTDAQKWAVEKGISDGTRPEDTITRAEVWSMLMRLTKE
nr:MAG TPA: N-acetylmuramoyl-L-alanine amidase [Caudoviricetes sp.]